MRVGALLLAAGLMAQPALAAGFNITSLFQDLAAQRPERAAFSEKKYLALLDRPVESSGELAFIPPDRN